MVPPELLEGQRRIATRRSQINKQQQARPSTPESLHSHTTCSSGSPPPAQQQSGDKTTEGLYAGRSSSVPTPVSELELRKEELGRNPGEKAFFKLLHAELKKASHFFEKAQQEYLIREERVKEGMDIMKQPNSIMVSERWSLLARSIYRLYKDLLLLETFAIMTYCSFSKILKKHDKVTGYQTRTAFMENVVNRANFTNYPRVLEMIGRCEQLYEQVSERLVHEGKDGLYEDERLFINMINRLNEQVLNMEPERKDSRSANRPPVQIDFPAAGMKVEDSAMSTLRSLVAENDAVANAAQVSEGHEGVDAEHDGKPPAQGRDSKRQRTD